MMGGDLCLWLLAALYYHLYVEFLCLACRTCTNLLVVMFSQHNEKSLSLKTMEDGQVHLYSVRSFCLGTLILYSLFECLFLFFLLNLANVLLGNQYLLYISVVSSSLWIKFLVCHHVAELCQCS